jgi:succinoglycan biosynthesis transport protein ExoP
VPTTQREFEGHQSTVFMRVYQGRKAEDVEMKVRAEKQGLSREIDGEIRRIVAVLKNEFEIATNREASLRESLKAGALRASSQRPEYVRLRELQREAESDKALYEAMLQRMKQAAAQETWKTADFRIVAEAVPLVSTRTSSCKSTLLFNVSVPERNDPAGIST